MSAPAGFRTLLQQCQRASSSITRGASRLGPYQRIQTVQRPLHTGADTLLLRSAAVPLARQLTTRQTKQCNLGLAQQRHESSSASPTGARPLTDRTDESPSSASTPKEEAPSYEMTFTCRACMERSSHRISKQGYHHGTILITCPGCKGRHLISDHLKIFSDKSITLEDIMREKGQLLKKGYLGSEGDVEFWDDGSQTTREKKAGKKEAAGAEDIK